MKGQVTVEELISLSVYLLLLSLLVTTAFQFKESGEEWGKRITLRVEAGQLARTEDAFHNNNIYNPYNWSGGGAGYLELREGELEATAPVLWGKMEVAKGEPV
ncbi:hypothetical protein GF412_00195 [Candidatus Micrarchaeota archaeon]|nr:hypothetical protein [Candidatus Micrarchaeota archaeon]MBD3417395.1 hypothetical protein [Candidatus Micrarchaeota archaeon]